MSKYVDIIAKCQKVGFIDADLLDNGTRHPNLALMKIAGYCISQGCDVELLDSYDQTDEYDAVFVSCVFTFTETPADLASRANVFIGGTGFYEDGGEFLPDCIEHHMPAYDIYEKYINKRIAEGRPRSWFADYLDYSIGFVTRGCFRKCSFCVNKKYSRAFRHSPVNEFVKPDRPYIYLWDDNFFAFSGWESILDELEETGKPFQFRQGLDIRLLDKRRAFRMSKTHYRGDFIFAFDHVEDKDLIEQKLLLWRSYSSRGTRLYVLCAYDSQDAADIENTFIRIGTLMKYGCLPYIMRYEKYKDSKWRGLYVQLARWCNQPQFFKKTSFREYCLANEEYHKNKATHSAAYIAMRDFERAHPDIALKYFDLKYEETNMYGAKRTFFRASPECDLCRPVPRVIEKMCNGEITNAECIEAYYRNEIDLECLSAGKRCDVTPEYAADRLIAILNSKSLDYLIGLLSLSRETSPVSAHNIPQFSSLEDVTTTVPELLSQQTDNLSFEDLGTMIDGGALKNQLARRKYGENHAKCAALLDLAVVEQTAIGWGARSSVMGTAYSRLNGEDRDELLPRLVLRIPIIQYLLHDALDKEICLLDYMQMLSESTMIRRRSSVWNLLQILADHSENNPTLSAALKNIRKQ